VTPGPAASGAGRPVRTIFFGSGAFAVPILEAVAARADLQLVAVVTPPDRPAGRRAAPAAVPVAVRAMELGLPLLQLARVRSAEAVAALSALGAALGILADFGQIIPPSVLELFRLGIVNLHPSALPRHRGATPIPAMILAGDPVAGVSLMQMDAGIDSGPLIAVRTWPLDGTEDATSLERTAAMEAARLLDAHLPAVLAGEATRTPQDPALATLTKPLHRADGRLDPSRPAAELERRVRACRPLPGTFLEIGVTRLAVLAARVAPSEPGDRPGWLVAAGAGIAVTTASGRLAKCVWT
jgi:methionyl-tRNA formyltransferase